MFSKEFNRNKCMQIKIKQKAMSSTAWYERCMSTRESSTSVYKKQVRTQYFAEPNGFWTFVSFFCLLTYSEYDWTQTVYE
jgi:hypothetical protein